MALPRALVHSGLINALFGWILTGIVTVVAVESFLTDAFLWGGFALFSLGIIVVPVVLTRDVVATVPWPLLLVMAVSMSIRALDVYREIAGYLAIATLALIVVIELDAFTPVEMSRRFAVGFAVLTTLAVQGLWIIAQFYSDRWWGTEFLRSQTELQWDIVIVTGVGIVLGGLFIWYFERFEHVGSHKRPVGSSSQS